MLYPVAALLLGAAYAALFASVGAAIRAAPGRLLLALPAGVVGLEWAMAHAGPLALSWHPAALTLASSSPLVQAADLAGTEGLGFGVVLVNAALAMAWHRRSSPSAALAHAGTGVALVGLLAAYGTYRLSTVTLTSGPTVSVVQPNATVREKGTPEAQDALVERTIELTRQALRSSDARLVVWPETALPSPLTSRPDWAASLDRLALREGITVLAGALEADVGGDGEGRRYNAAFRFPAPRSTPRAMYRKRKLVPVVETALLSAWDPRRQGSGRLQPGQPARLRSTPGGRNDTLLCYEITFAGMARALRRGGADVLVTLSNDAWLGRTAGPHQHFAHARLRAVETRTTVVRAANSGVSGIIDPLGRVIVRTPLFVETHVSGPLYRTRVAPPAIVLAEWVGPLALSLLVALCGLPPGRRIQPR